MKGHRLTTVDARLDVATWSLVEQRSFIAAWIAHAVKQRPEAMKLVVESRFGDLNEWIWKIEHGHWCGCLIGSTALAAFGMPGSKRWSAAYERAKKNFPVEAVDEAVAVCTAAVGDDQFDAHVTEKVGLAVAELAIRIGQEPTISWIKQAIATHLKGVYRE